MKLEQFGISIQKYQSGVWQRWGCDSADAVGVDEVAVAVDDVAADGGAVDDDVDEPEN